MLITKIPQFFLSLLLYLPVVAGAAPKSVSSDSGTTVKVQPVKQTRQQAAATPYPQRGMTMAQVRKQYGTPNSVRKSTGKIKKQWPRITVWNYGKFSVYFERRITLHTVVH